MLPILPVMLPLLPSEAATSASDVVTSASNVAKSASDAPLLPVDAATGYVGESCIGCLMPCCHAVPCIHPASPLTPMHSAVATCAI